MGYAGFDIVECEHNSTDPTFFAHKTAGDQLEIKQPHVVTFGKKIYAKYIEMQ